MAQTTTLKSPFKFLDAYEKEDKAFFFGREKEVEELYELTFESNLILLYGASGSGKTSLINCGLSNKFQDTDWFDMFVRRGNNLNESLRKEIEHHATTPIPVDAPLRRALKSLFYDYYKPIYLIFDQFEELFILGDHAEQQLFFKTIGELLQLNLQLTIILSMREEYLAYLSDFEEIIPSLFDHRFRVEGMSKQNLERVVTGTVKHFGIEVAEPETTVPQIVDNLWNPRTGGDLTSLQVYLHQLYERFQVLHPAATQMVYSPELIQSVGELKDVLANFLDDQIQVLEGQMPPEKAHIPMDVIFYFVTDEGTKRPATIEAIKESLFRRKGIRSEDVDYCLDFFRSIRIFRELEA